MLPRRPSALYTDVVDRLTEQSVRWRSMALLFAFGGALALATLLLPAPPDVHRPAVAALGLSAIAASILMHAGADRLPRRVMSPALVFGTLLVTGGVVATGDTGSVYALFYVWIGFEAFFFLSKRQALLHVGFAAAAYAAALYAVAGSGTMSEARWVMTIGTVAIIGLLAGTLNDRAERLIARLADATKGDQLTGLLNRRGFEERLELELARARRTGGPVGLIVADLDNLKTINDRLGHAAGDAALVRFADVARESKRAVDGLGRTGGEEFGLVLPDTDAHGAFVLAERIRRALSATDGANASFGIAAYPRHGVDVEGLLHCADQALYLAKELGRDRSVIHSAEVAANVVRGRDVGVPHIEQAGAVLVLAETLDLRDTGTATHSHTVGEYAERIARQIGFPDERVERVRLAGLLHDIGKVGVADEILNKPGRLTQAEWDEMRKHPELGARILAGANLDDISAWVLAHHERPDGGGYPSGLRDAHIPLEAKILAVADSYEAMTSDRCYRAALGSDEARRELERCAGSQFDPRVVAAFLAALDARTPSAA